MGSRYRLTNSCSRLSISLLVLFFCLGISAQALAQRTPDVHFVPTPMEAVMEMLQVAGVGPGDVVYDLGCGDGRFVINAVQKFGAKRGVGIDIDPVRVKESRENAISAGVSDRTTFFQGDLFESDFRDASVVTLYLLPSLNLKLRPKLFRELKPGSRIVSYAFDMDDWKADVTSRVGSSSRYYFWILPADVAGTWDLTVAAPAGPAYTLDIAQKYQQINGNALAKGKPIILARPELRGERLSFSLQDEVGGLKVTLSFDGVVTGNRAAGEVLIEGGPQAVRHPWQAVRRP